MRGISLEHIWKRLVFSISIQNHMLSDAVCPNVELLKLILVAYGFIIINISNCQTDVCLGL